MEDPGKTEAQPTIKGKNQQDRIIGSSFDCVVMTNRKGYIVGANKPFLELFGYEEEEVIGRHIACWGPPKEGIYESIKGELVEINEEHFDNVGTMILTLIKEGRVSNWKTYYRHKDEKLIFVEQTVTYLYNERGDKTGAVGIIRDITERKRVGKSVGTGDILENIFGIVGDEAVNRGVKNGAANDPGNNR